MSLIKTHTIETPFVTESGFQLYKPIIAYQTWGKLNPGRDNVIVICHALTGNTAADEWFGGLLGAGRPADSNRHFIICANVLGSCYGTTGPTSINPETGRAYKGDFPQITIRDIVRLQQHLFDALGIKEIKMVIGGSMGGMQALELSIMDHRPQSAVFIGMGKSHSPWAIAISHAQRQAIYNDPNWRDGFYDDESKPEKGLAVARMIAMNTYRHPIDFEKKFSRDLQGEDEHYKVESYLNHQGKKLAQRFDAVAYERLTRAMDSHDVARGRSSYQQVLRAVDIPTLVIGIDSDLLYPPHEQQELAQLLPNSSFHKLNSKHGHDAFLIEFEQLNRLIVPFLNETPTSIAI